jgi:SAM-dependent methyltransferase
MPIIPQNQEPHRARAVAESFGVDAERYDRTRPRYPQGLIDAVVAASPGTDVLDVGCGTGIAARQLRAAGCRVLGVEPDPRMAAVARRHGVPVEEATFEEWDASGRTFDAVVAGQAWHWIDPVAGAARAAAVLRPGGRLAVFWNVTLPPPELARAFAAVYQRILPDSPAGAFLATSGTDDPYGPLCEKASDGIRQGGGFGEPQRRRFDAAQHYTREQWLDLVSTMGGHGLLPPPVLDELLAGLGAAVDAAGGGFTMAQHTVAVTAARA